MNPQAIFDLVHSMWQSTRDPQLLHAMLVHLPVAISVIGLLAVILIVIMGGRWTSLRWLTVALYILGVAGSYFASTAGERAMERLDLIARAGASDTLGAHERMGQFVWLWLLGCAIVVSMTGVSNKVLRVIMLIAALVVSVGASGWVAATAHHGGQLVYKHGLGTPGTLTELPAIIEPTPSAQSPAATEPPPQSPAEEPVPTQPVEPSDPSRPNIFEFGQ